MHSHSQLSSLLKNFLFLKSYIEINFTIMLRNESQHSRILILKFSYKFTNMNNLKEKNEMLKSSIVKWWSLLQLTMIGHGMMLALIVLLEVHHKMSCSCEINKVIYISIAYCNRSVHSGRTIGRILKRVSHSCCRVTINWRISGLIQKFKVICLTGIINYNVGKIW